MARWRIGVDLGGTKIEVAAMAEEGKLDLRRRVPTPRGYEAVIALIAELVAAAEAALDARATVGVGIPGSLSPTTGLVRNANSTVLNGRPIERDLSAALGRTVRVANDANCFALSEARDGAGAGFRVVFGVIIGTGCGGGVVVDGVLRQGRNDVGGEWGHNPLPWPRAEELPGVRCWCGKWNCLDQWVTGPALARDCDGAGATDASKLPARAAAGDAVAQAALDRHADRLARGLVHVIHILDPDAIVLGGGLSNMAHLYRALPALIARHLFGDSFATPILRHAHGDSSGVRGAAWLWPADADAYAAGSAR